MPNVQSSTWKVSYGKNSPAVDDVLQYNNLNDVRMNEDPTSPIIQWICTVAGRPGTWTPRAGGLGVSTVVTSITAGSGISVTGTSTVPIVGSTINLTNGSVVVSAGGTALTENNPNFYYDVANKRLHLNTAATPVAAAGAPLSIHGSSGGTAILMDEGTNTFIDKANGDLILRVVNANSLHVWTNGNNDRWYWDLNGSVVFNPGAVVGGGTAFQVFPGAHTAMAGEVIDWFVNSRTATFAAGATIPTQRQIIFQGSTYAASSARTLTIAATLAVSGAPAQGTNVTITNAYSIWVDSGKVRFDDQLSVGSTVTLDTLAGATATLVKTSTLGVLSRGVVTTDYPSPAATYWVASNASIPTNGVNLGALSTGLVKITVSGGVATPSTAAVTTDYPSPLATYWVASNANIPTNGVNLGALSTGIVKITVAAGVATPSDAVAGTDYLLPFSLTSGSVVFSGGGSVLSQNNNNFFWDATNARLVLGNGGAFTPAAGAPLTVNGASATNIAIQLSQASTNQYILKSGGGILRVGTTTSDAFELHTNNTARVAIDANGNQLLTSSGASGSSTVFFESRAPANTAVASELFAYWFRADATVQFAAGATIGQQRTFVFQPATYSAASARTITTAASLVVLDAPSAGTNISITQRLAFWVASGDARIQGNAIVDSLGGGTSEIVKASTTGVLQRAAAGTDYMGVLSLTAGSILFSGGGSVISQDNNNLYWDDANNRLHIAKGSAPTLAAGPTTTIYSANSNSTLTSGGASLLFENSSSQTLMTFSFSGTVLSGLRADSAGNCNWHASGSQGHQFYQSTSTANSLAGINSLGIILGGGAGANATNAPVEIANAHGTTSDAIKMTKAALQRITKSGGDLYIGTQASNSVFVFTNNTVWATWSSAGTLTQNGPAAGNSLIVSDGGSNSTITFSHAATHQARIRTGTDTLALGAGGTDFITMSGSSFVLAVPILAPGTNLQGFMSLATSTGNVTARNAMTMQFGGPMTAVGTNFASSNIYLGQGINDWSTNSSLAYKVPYGCGSLKVTVKFLNNTLSSAGNLIGKIMKNGSAVSTIFTQAFNSLSDVNATTVAVTFAQNDNIGFELSSGPTTFITGGGVDIRIVIQFD